MTPMSARTKCKTVDESGFHMLRSPTWSKDEDGDKEREKEREGERRRGREKEREGEGERRREKEREREGERRRETHSLNGDSPRVTHPTTNQTLTTGIERTPRYANTHKLTKCQVSVSDILFNTTTKSATCAHPQWKRYIHDLWTVCCCTHHIDDFFQI